jgi:DeoR/GlpR family transcriptional regulator of sugar metabolism
MLTAERRQYILEALQREGRVLSSELSAALNVSEDTIRRDLRDLAESGLIQRVHGGALPRSPAATSYGAREGQATAAKAAIAQAALQLIGPGQVIIMDGGTTTLQVAQQLPPALHATIITNSPPIALTLAQHTGVQLILIGGQLYKEGLVTSGAAAVEALRLVRADLCLLGICSLHPEVGISVPNYEEAHVKRAMIASAAEVAALASAEKLGTASPHIVGPLTELTHLITEAAVPPATLAPYARLGLTVIKAEG